jgi:hypothetical protein
VAREGSLFQFTEVGPPFPLVFLTSPYPHALRWSDKGSLGEESSSLMIPFVFFLPLPCANSPCPSMAPCLTC